MGEGYGVSFFYNGSNGVSGVNGSNGVNGELCIAHDSQPVAAPDFFDIGFTIATAQERTREIDEFGCVGESADASVTIEVGA